MIFSSSLEDALDSDVPVRIKYRWLSSYVDSTANEAAVSVLLNKKHVPPELLASRTSESAVSRSFIVVELTGRAYDNREAGLSRAHFRVTRGPRFGNLFQV